MYFITICLKLANFIYLFLMKLFNLICNGAEKYATNSTIKTETMKTLLLFDSYFGNTEHIARAIAKAFADEKEITVKRNNETGPEELSDYEFLIIGSPTRGFRPTDDVTNLIKKLESNSLKGIKVATFDTRIFLETIKSKFARKVVDFGGYAAKQLTTKLEKKGATAVIEPEGFYVMDSEGPLKDGELERAENWGKQIIEAFEKES